MTVDRSSHHWLPFTQMAEFERNPRAFVRGAGTMLTDAQGNDVFDAISSVWTTIHGHCRPEIVAAIARQAATLDHSTALGATNPVAEELAERLALLTGLDRAFFSSDGASAVEVALKMALKYWENVGDSKRRLFVRLADSYHGDTTGAMSVSDIAGFKASFGAICFETLAFDALGEVLSRDDVAAVIVEPTVQAAAGIRLVRREHYEALRRSHAPLLIVDEIATGFGRTGEMFAFSTLELKPDLLCLGKGITGGTLALSATMASEKIYRAFLGGLGDGKHLFHGHSYAANPIACAAALASLDLFERENTLAHANELARGLTSDLETIRVHPRIKEVRQAGLMCGIELDGRAFEGSSAPTPGWHVASRLYDRGYFTRPIGNVIQLVPPLSSTSKELSGFVASLREVLDS